MTSKYAMAATATMNVVGLDGEVITGEDGKPVSLTFHSTGTKVFRKIRHEADQRNSGRAMARMQGKPGGVISVDQSTEENAEYLASLVESHHNLKELGVETPKELFTAFDLMYIADDSEKFLGDRANFKKPSVSK